MFSTLSHIFISLHCNHCWSFKKSFEHNPVQKLDIFQQDSYYSTQGIHSQGIYAMPPDSLLTELHDSLTAFYENILKKPRLQQCPNSEAAPAGAGDADADADDVKSPCAAVEPLPPTLHRRWLLRRKPQRKPQPCPRKTGAADQRVGRTKG